MSDSDAVSKTVSTLQSAYNLAKGIADLNEAHAIKVQIGELQAQILSAQESVLRSQEREAALTRRAHELEQRIAQMETWSAEKQRYELKDFGGGTFAYLLQQGMENDEPPHRLCAQENKKSILQFQLHNVMSQDVYNCPACQHEFHFGVPKDPPAAIIESEFDPLE